ncbi:T4 family baseplate hub assembly chaperone [Streptomyces decoyicus]
MAVRALSGSDEAALGIGEDPDGERWAARVLITAVRDPEGGRLSPEDLRALSVGDRNALLLTLVAATYGARVQWVVACPSCGEQLDAEVNLAELVGAAAGPHEELVAAGCALPTCGDLEAVAGLPDADEARRTLLDRCVGSWQSLDEESLAAVESLMAQADPLADIELLLICPACASEVPAELDPRAELAARLATPRQLIRDVHTLALAYGWTEPEVLALPRPHRSEYLGLIADGEL